MKSNSFILILCIMVASFVIYSCVKETQDKKAFVDYQTFQLETKAEEPCENAMMVCSPPLWSAPIILNISHPDYPGCTFQVKYKEQECLPFGYDLQIEEWALLSPGCQSWDDSLNNAGANAALFIQRTEKQLMTLLVNHILSLPAINAQIPECGNGNFATLFGFTVGACIKFCIVQTGTQITPNGELIEVKYVKVPCSEACCRTTYEVCRNRSGRLTIIQSWSNGTGNCYGQSPLLPCPLNTIGSTPCLPNCQGI